MDVDAAPLGLPLVALALAALVACARWWPRRRDRATLLGLLSALNLLVVAGLSAFVLDRLDARASAPWAVAGWAWLAVLAVAATFAVVPRDAPAGVSRSTLVLHAALAGMACGPLVLLGLALPTALEASPVAFGFILVYGGLLAAGVGLVVGVAVGLLDALVLRRLTRGARSP